MYKIQLVILTLLSTVTTTTQQQTNGNKATNNQSDIIDNNTNSTLTTEDGSREIIPIPTLGEFCKLINITLGCTCQNSNLREQYPDIIPTLCGEIQNETETKFFQNKQIAIASITTVTMAFGLAGNLLVIAVLFKNRKTLPYTKVLICQLAFVDALFSVNNLVSEIHLFWSPKWILGLGMCKFITSTYTLSSLLSIGYILVIALERYFGILYSMKRKLSSKYMVYGCVGVNFIIGIAAVIPLLCISVIDQHGVCYDFKIHGGEKFEQIYNWVLLVVYIIIPMLVISYIYICIIRYLTIQAKQNTAINREDIRLKRNKSNRRTMKILLSIMVAFLACVLPTRLCKLYIAYFRDGRMSWFQMELIRYVTTITYSLHLCVNPIIYSAVDRENRIHMLEMIGVRKKRCDSTSSTMRFYSTVRGRRVTQFTVIPP